MAVIRLFFILEWPQLCYESEAENKCWLCRCHGNCIRIHFNISAACAKFVWIQCQGE